MGNNNSDPVESFDKAISDFTQKENYMDKEKLKETKKLLNDIFAELKKLRNIQDIREKNNDNKVDTLLKKIDEKIDKESISKKKIEEIENIISNLQNLDKFYFKAKFFFDNKLIDSIEEIKNKAINDNLKEMKKNVKTLNLNDEIKILKDINNQMEEIVNYLYLHYSKSILYEKFAENYYIISKKLYSKFKDNSLSEMFLDDSIIYMDECVKYYEMTKNCKIKLIEYKEYLNCIKSQKNILIGNELLKEEKYLQALGYYENIDCDDSTINQTKEEQMSLCHQNLGKIEEERALYEKEKENFVEMKLYYEKAKEHYSQSKNYDKLFELNYELNTINIEEIIKENAAQESINYFKNIFDVFKNIKKEEYFKYFDKINTDFLILLIRLSIISLKKNRLDAYINFLDNYNKKDIGNEKMKSIINELISELNNFRKKNENNILEYIKESLRPENSEIKKRFNLSVLIIKYLNNKGNEVIILLSNDYIRLNYLTFEGYSYFLDYIKSLDFSNKLYSNQILLTSKLLYNIIISNFYYTKKSLNIICEKLMDICDNATNLQIYSDIIESLASSFQEIMINNKQIAKEEYESLKNVIISVICFDKKFINSFLKVLFFLTNKEIDLNLLEEDELLKAIEEYSFRDENILQILFSQIQIQKEKNIINEFLEKIYLLLLKYQENELCEQNEELIFTFLLNLLHNQEEAQKEKKENGDLVRQIILNNKYHLKKYLEGNNIHPLCYKLIEKIPVEERFPIMTEKLKSFKERYIKYNENDLGEENLKDRLKFIFTITKNELSQIEKKLDDKYYIKKLIHYLKRQNYLFKFLKTEEITEHFSISEIDLINLMIDNKINFNEKSLLNILKGFYNNNPKEIYETINILNKIRGYQDKFPLIIEKNLNLELFLYNENYQSIKNFDSTLTKFFEDYFYLKGFADQHRKFALYLLILDGNNQKDMICERLLKFFIDNNYDIGITIYNKILENITIDNFIKNIPDILIKYNIDDIKDSTLNKLYNLIKSEKNKEKLLKMLKQFKYFIDYVTFSNPFLELLISLVKAEKGDIYKEIIFILGIYFSTEKRNFLQENYLNDIVKIISENEIYKYIINNVKTVYKKNEIFYLFSCLINIDFQINNDFDENYLLNIPIEIIKKEMKHLNGNLNDNQINENIALFNNFYQLEEFCPKRDQYLREIYFNNQKNSIYKLKIVLN